MVAMWQFRATSTAGVRGSPDVPSWPGRRSAFKLCFIQSQSVSFKKREQHLVNATKIYTVVYYYSLLTTVPKGAVSVVFHWCCASFVETNEHPLPPQQQHSNATNGNGNIWSSLALFDGGLGQLMVARH